MARPPKKHKKVCRDSCVWIACIQNEKLRLPNGTIEDRGALCRAVLEDAAKGTTDVYTSALSLAEVSKQPSGTPPGTDKLREFFENDYIVTVQLDRRIGEMARGFMQAGHAKLKPLDAVHLASAVLSNVDEFNTFDEALLALDGKIIKSDGTLLVICKPALSGSDGPLFDATEDRSDDADQTEQGNKPEGPDSPSIPGGGAVVGVPGGRGGIRPSAEGDSVGGADSEAPAEKATVEDMIEHDLPLNAGEDEIADDRADDNPAEPWRGAPDEPFHLGLAAFASGKDLSDNPYLDDDPNQHEWITGWYTAEQRAKD